MSVSKTTCTQAQTLMMEVSLALPSDEFLMNANDEALLIQHLANCADCRSYQNSMRHLTDSLKTLDSVPVPSGLTDRIMQAIEAKETATQSTVVPLQDRAVTAGKKRFELRPLMAIAATVLLLFLAWPMLQMDEEQPRIAPEERVAATKVATPEPQMAAPENSSSQKVVAEVPAQTMPSKRLSFKHQIKKPARSTVHAVDTSKIASAKPEADSIALDELTVGNQSESDGFSDPVGNLVGF